MKKLFWIAVALIVGYLIISPLTNPSPTVPSRTNPTDYEDFLLQYDSSSDEEDYYNNYDNDASDSFNGYPCTEDYSGHEAGYNWAVEKGINSIDDCGGNSNSFIEGCESYVEENYSDDY